MSYSERHEEWWQRHQQAVARHDEEMAELRALVGHIAQMLENFIKGKTNA